MSTRARYDEELKRVFDNLVLMCRHIELAIENCVKALIDRDFELAREVYEDDKMINKVEREIEGACLKLLVMEHPVARDFREITTALKMITDLERIGDQARDIAEITMQLGAAKQIEDMASIPHMATIVIQMVKDGVLAYINHDVDLARTLNKADDKVDALFDAVMEDLAALIKKNPDIAKEAIMFMMITKYLERIGDHAVNIGEWVEYAITGIHPKSQ